MTEEEKEKAGAEESVAEFAPQPEGETTIETEVKNFIDDSSYDRVYNSSTLIQVFGPHIEKCIETLWNLRNKDYVIHRHWFKGVEGSYSIPEEQVIYKDIEEFKKEVLGGKQFQVLSPRARELLKKAGERDEYLNMLLRAKADFQNYQKRARKEIEALNHLAVQDVMRALLPVLDNLYRAVKSVGKPDTQSLEKFLHGVALTQDQFLKVLNGFGVKVIHGQEGQAFNPALHEAIMEVENDKFPHHTVLEEIEQGFFLNDKVLRPAKVKVSKRTAAKAGEATVAEGGKGSSAKGVDETTEDTAKVSPKTTQGLNTGPVPGEEEPVV